MSDDDYFKERQRDWDREDARRQAERVRREWEMQKTRETARGGNIRAASVIQGFGRDIGSGVPPRSLIERSGVAAFLEEMLAGEQLSTYVANKILEIENIAGLDDVNREMLLWQCAALAADEFQSKKMKRLSEVDRQDDENHRSGRGRDPALKHERAALIDELEKLSDRRDIAMQNFRKLWGRGLSN